MFAVGTDVGYHQYPSVLKPMFAVGTDVSYHQYPRCTEDCCWDRYEILPVPQVSWRQCLLLKQMWDAACTPSVLKIVFAVRCGLLPVPQVYWKECLLSQMWVTTCTLSILKSGLAPSGSCHLLRKKASWMSFLLLCGCGGKLVCCFLACFPFVLMEGVK